MFDFLSRLFHKSNSARASSERSDGLHVQSSGPAAEIRIKPKIEAHFSVNEVSNKNATDVEVRFSPRTGHKTDNLNYLCFAGTGLFIKTNRQRKASAEAFSLQEAIDELVDLGYDRDSLDIHEVPPEPSTIDQVKSMRDHNDYMPEPMCKVDASYLIGRYMYDEHSPDQEILDFATSRKIKLSYYIGLESLYWQIWQNSSRRECLAFFLCCVSKDSKGNWQFGRYDEFLRLADQLLEDNRFMKSFREYYSFDSFKGFGSGQYRRRLCYTIPAAMV